MLVGNCCCLVLYWVAVSLYSWRANATLFSVDVSSSCRLPFLAGALGWGYCSTTTMRRWSADDRAFSAWLICLMPSGPAALTFTAWLRAWITASSVDRSNSIAPLTAFTRLGMRSWRRLSWTSICLNAFSVWFLREMSPLYAPISHPTTTTRTISNTRSEEHTSELQSRPHLVCRLLLEKKKK